MGAAFVTQTLRFSVYGDIHQFLPWNFIYFNLLLFSYNFSIIKNNSHKNVINFKRFNYDAELKLKKKIKKGKNNYINIYNISPEKKCVSIRLTSKIIGEIYI